MYRMFDLTIGNLFTIKNKFYYKLFTKIMSILYIFKHSPLKLHQNAIVPYNSSPYENYFVN